MGFINKALLGIASFVSIKYVTKKNSNTGRSIADDLIDKAPEYVENVKGYVNRVKEEITQKDY